MVSSDFEYLFGLSSAANSVIFASSSNPCLGFRSTNNLVTENYAAKNLQGGIRLVSSAGNILSLNKLVASRKDVYDDGDTNLWYSSESHKGNFYSEYQNCTDTDSNGICDRAYLIPGGSGSDSHPLAISFLAELPAAIQKK